MPRAWHTIGTDLLTLEGAEYLISIHLLGRYQGDKTYNSLTVVKLLRQIFSEQGIPKLLGSGNGQHCNGQVFQDFARELDFQHVISTANYPRSISFIVSQVISVKAAPLKAKTTHREPDMTFLCLRIEPNLLMTHCHLPPNYFSVEQSRTTSRRKFP